MSLDSNPNKPMVLLAFANDLGSSSPYLRLLSEEARRIRTTLEQGMEQGSHTAPYGVVVRQNATIEDLFDAFRAHRDRVTIFHFGGHANGYELYFENSQGQLAAARAEGLAAFLGRQRGLRLVFLNGCSSRDQARSLLAANIDVVIATDRDVEDDVALHFGDHFYRGLVSGATLETAFYEAVAAAQLVAGANHGWRPLYPAPTTADAVIASGWPWDLYVRPGDEAKLQWKLVDDRVAARAPSAEATQPPAQPTPPPALPAVPNPYRGLEPFEFEHAANYFGRAAMVEKLLAKLQATNFVAVVGPSGSGKSSLVRAGLVTALAEGRLTGSKDWSIAIIRPGDDPLRALATPLVNQIGPALQPVERLKQVREMADGLLDGSLPIGDVLAEVRTLYPGLPRLLLIFDQFEETFALCSDEALRRTFLQTLLTAANTPWVTILFTLRADFYGRVLADEPLGKRVDAGLVNVLPMTAEERRDAIEQPARNAGRRFDEGLVQTILDDIEAEPGELPLLQFALTELWERQTADGVLTHAAYREIGGVSGAIAKRADQTLKSLQDAERVAVRRIFTRLVRVAPPDEGAEDTKRRIALIEVDATIQALVYKLADARLLVTGRDEQSGSETVEVAHEALIRGWDELKVWLNSDREFLLWRQRLRSLVANWVASKADEGALLRGALLTEANIWLQTRRADLSEQERSFITAGQDLADREEREKEAVQRRERRSLWIVSSLLLLVLLSGAIAVTYGYDDLQRARALDRFDRAMQFKAEGNVTEALTELVAAATALPSLVPDMQAETADVYRQKAIQLVRAGEDLAGKGDLTGAAAKYQAALDLKPPLDTPVYVRVPAGEFTMGSTSKEQYSYNDEKPQHKVTLDEFWILRTEVTNWQYAECVAAGACTEPDNQRWHKPQLRNWPVTHVYWHQASQYAAWKGGRLPTEAEWEKACRGTDVRPYPWGDELPTETLTNYNFNEGTITDVGNYVDGQSPYGLLDMAGNAWEWTSSQYQSYPYRPNDGREKPTSGDDRTLRGGAFNRFEDEVRCAYRYSFDPSDGLVFVGFRLLSPGF